MNKSLIKIGWCSADGNKVFALLEDGRIFFNNHKTSDWFELKHPFKIEGQETEYIETSTGKEYKKIDCNGVIK